MFAEHNLLLLPLCLPLETLTKYAESPPAELKDFYAGKVKYNDKYNKSVRSSSIPTASQVLTGSYRSSASIYFGSPDDTELKKYYSEANTLWTNVGDFLNKQLPSYLKQRNGTPYFGGDKPGEVDCKCLVTPPDRSKVKRESRMAICRCPTWLALTRLAPFLFDI